MSVGIGLCVNNTRAVLEAVFGRSTPFERTPKLRVEGRSRPRTRGGVYAVAHGIYASIPFLLLFQAGYLYTAFLSLGQWARLRKA
jgi:hypothetical protein